MQLPPRVCAESPNLLQTAASPNMPLPSAVLQRQPPLLPSCGGPSLHLPPHGNGIRQSPRNALSAVSVCPLSRTMHSDTPGSHVK
jgi:hypothetical protein